MIDLLIGPITELVGKFVPDKTEANRLAHEIATLAEKQHHEVTLAQIEVNKEEAGSHSLFVSGWRPAIGWICGASMAFNYIAAPLATGFGFPMPPLDISTMMPVLLGMLGLGGLRTFEKHQKVARNK